MSISYNDAGELRTIPVSGRLDAEGTDSVAAQLQQLANAPQKKVVVDLSSLKFLASVGIGAIIACAKAVKQRGGRMVLVAKSGSTVMMSIQATGVDQFVPVFGSESDAERAALA